MYQLDDESNCAHDAEANANSLAQLKKLLLVGLLAAVDELHAVLEELAGNIENLFDLIGHCDDCCGSKRREEKKDQCNWQRSRVSWRKARERREGIQVSQQDWRVK